MRAGGAPATAHRRSSHATLRPAEVVHHDPQRGQCAGKVRDNPELVAHCLDRSHQRVPFEQLEIRHRELVVQQPAVARSLRECGHEPHTQAARAAARRSVRPAPRSRCRPDHRASPEPPDSPTHRTGAGPNRRPRSDPRRRRPTRRCRARRARRLRADSQPACTRRAASRSHPACRAPASGRSARRSDSPSGPTGGRCSRQPVARDRP